MLGLAWWGADVACVAMRVKLFCCLNRLVCCNELTEVSYAWFCACASLRLVTRCDPGSYAFVGSKKPKRKNGFWLFQPDRFYLAVSVPQNENMGAAETVTRMRAEHTVLVQKRRRLETALEGHAKVRPCCRFLVPAVTPCLLFSIPL